MADQYQIADSFLKTLCDRFLDGDKRRMVLTPGNHDVCWNTSFLAMEEVPGGEYPTNIQDALAEPNTVYRWCWEKRALFRISDVAAYERRMDYYWSFLETFYSDVELPMPIDRSRGFQFFELRDRQVAVAAFDSVAGNDCFSYSGAIPRDAIGRCALAIRDLRQAYDLKVAVWHHSIHGPPMRTDYMDISQVHELIGHGFQLGLHGHQHIATIQNQRVFLDEGRSMAVASTGSLCAGAKELPRGVNRQYNLIVIEDDFLHARIHVREAAEGDQFTGKRNGQFLDGFVEVSWQPATDIMGREVDAETENTRRATMCAEEALHAGKFADALKALRHVDSRSVPHARRLLIEALLAEKSWFDLIQLLHDSPILKEIITLIVALTESDRLEEAQIRLDEAPEVDGALRRDLQDRIDARRLMRRP